MTLLLAFLGKHWLKLGALAVAFALGGWAGWSAGTAAGDRRARAAEEALREQKQRADEAWGNVAKQNSAVEGFVKLQQAQQKIVAAELASARRTSERYRVEAADLLAQQRPAGLSPCENACRILRETRP